MIKYTITLDFIIRIDYQSKQFRGVKVTVYADGAKQAVGKAQRLLWDGAYDVEVTNISAEEERVAMLHEKVQEAYKQGHIDARMAYEAGLWDEEEEG